MAASSTNVQYLLGDLYDAMGSSKADIVTAMITRAQAYVDEYTGSKTGTIIDAAVEDFAALYCVQRMVAGSSSAHSITIGEISLGEKQIATQIRELRRQGNEKLKQVGRATGRYTLTTNRTT